MEKNSFVFIDNGFDTLKCASLSTNVLHDFDYFMVPTYVVPHLQDIQNLNFNKQKMEKRINLFVETQLIQLPFDLGQPPPIHQGKIGDLDAFAFAWQQIVGEFLKPAETLRNADSPPDHDFGVLMSEPAVNVSERFEQREEIAQIAFEALGASRFALVPQAALKLFAELKFSGIVVDFGAGLTQIVPVENGYASFSSADCFRVSGHSVDQFLLYSL